MFVRGGAIILMGPEMKYIGEKAIDPITFAIYPDERGSAATIVYEDDGLTPAYERGVFRRTAVNVRLTTRGYVVNVNAPEGTYNPGTRKFTFLVKKVPAAQVTLNDSGTAQTVLIR